MEVELDDGIRDFIEEKMSKVDPEVYTKKEFNIFFSSPHRIFSVVNKQGSIVAFCGIHVREKDNKMCYTWCSDTLEGKKAYARGLDYMLTNYSPISFAKGALKFNKIKRMMI